MNLKTDKWYVSPGHYQVLIMGYPQSIQYIQLENRPTSYIRLNFLIHALFTEKLMKMWKNSPSCSVNEGDKHPWILPFIWSSTKI